MIAAFESKKKKKKEKKNVKKKEKIKKFSYEITKYELKLNTKLKENKLEFTSCYLCNHK